MDDETAMAYELSKKIHESHYRILGVMKYNDDEFRPAQPTRRLVRKWAIYQISEGESRSFLWGYTMDVHTAMDKHQYAQYPSQMFSNPYDSLVEAEQALLEWGQYSNGHAQADYVILPVYRVEVMNADA